ncbi:hypothetical protein B4U80_13951 [Leptotrombidium deliense]|uniref:Thyroglobulin type-1 domain-containing protein n=1 Tax=Leptotrombidium deliense TaxID=299467 RepID=A0A443S6U1_9ACAR|nr:hypothetical protein B4U80_13951 [Leptotrombidium deliense]
MVIIHVCFASKCLEELKENDRLRTQGVQDLFGPVCASDGKYEKIQCMLLGCYCVNEDTGEKIGDIFRWGRKPECK